MTIALTDEAERMIQEFMSSGKYVSESEVVKEALSALTERVASSRSPRTPPTDSQVRRIGEMIDEMMKDIPEEALAKMPVDGSEQHDHYIYGTPKRT